RMDLLLDNARKAATANSRKTLYNAAFRVLRAELPLIYLYHDVVRHGVTTNVKGVRLYGDGLIRAYLAEYK
ncbi:MAG: ABC transporter substrate-binding protein, partial [Gaiellaceae bacterium]